MIAGSLAAQSGSGVYSKTPMWTQDEGGSWVDLAAPDDMAAPHVFTFGALVSTGFRTYWQNYHDEAIRHRRENAMAMRRDAFLFSLLRERKEAVLSLRWELTVDDDRDPWQISVRDAIWKGINSYMWIHRMKRQLLESLWFGKAGVQIKWGWKNVLVPTVERKGPIDPLIQIQPQTVMRMQPMLLPRRHLPVNGDKIGWTFSGQPTILINPAYADELERRGATTIPNTDGGRALILDGTWRDRFIISTHNPDDEDYFRPEAGSAAYGVGLRSRAYWNNFMRSDYYSWVVSSLNRLGVGVVLVEYDASNPAAESEADEVIRGINRNSVIKVPVDPERMGNNESVRILEAPTGGVEAVMRLIEHQEAQIERLFVGQQASSRSETSGLGTHDTGFQERTKSQLTRSDARELQAILTGDNEEPGLVSQVKRWSFDPMMDFPVYWNFIVEEPDSLEAVDKVMALMPRIKFRSDDVRNLTGLPKPDENDESVGGEEQEIIDQQRMMGTLGMDQMGGDENGGDGDDSSGDGGNFGGNGGGGGNGKGAKKVSKNGDGKSNGDVQLGDPMPSFTYWDPSDAVLYEVRHAPEGGVTIDGTYYPGGQFVPGGEYNKATPEQKRAIDSGESVPELPAAPAGAQENAPTAQNVPLAHKVGPEGPTPPQAPQTPEAQAGQMTPDQAEQVGQEALNSLIDLDKRLAGVQKSMSKGEEQLIDFLNEYAGGAVETGLPYGAGVVWGTLQNIMGARAFMDIMSTMKEGRNAMMKQGARKALQNMPLTDKTKAAIVGWLPMVDEILGSATGMVGPAGSVAYLAIAAAPYLAWKGSQNLAHIPSLLASLVDNPATAAKIGKDLAGEAVGAIKQFVKEGGKAYVSGWVRPDTTDIRQGGTTGSDKPQDARRGSDAPTRRSGATIGGPEDVAKFRSMQPAMKSIYAFYAAEGEGDLEALTRYMDQIPDDRSKLLFEAILYTALNTAKSAEEAAAIAIQAHQGHSAQQQAVKASNKRNGQTEYAAPTAGEWPRQPGQFDPAKSNIDPASPVPIAPLAGTPAVVGPTGMAIPFYNREELSRRGIELDNQIMQLDGIIGTTRIRNAGAPEGHNQATNTLMTARELLNQQRQLVAKQMAEASG